MNDDLDDSFTARAKTPEPQRQGIEGLERDNKGRQVRSLTEDDVPRATKGVSVKTEMSWLQKRKMHIEARISGQRCMPPEPPVPICPPPLPPPKPKVASGEKTWAQRRKEAYLKTHGGVPLQTDVGATAVMFAARLRTRSTLSKASEAGNSDRREGGDSERAESLIKSLAESLSAGAPPIAPPIKQQPSAETKSWKQKRKEKYLRLHPKTNSNTVATVDAVSFVVRLQEASRRSSQSAPEES